MDVVNVTVVRAMMALRQISVNVVANLVHCRQDHMTEWLNGESDQIPFERQLEVLRLIGIHSESPRQDVVHDWSITEPFFGKPDTIYWALIVLLKTFGKAEVMYLAQEQEPGLSGTNKSFFYLAFSSFKAILTVSGSALRSLRFEPEKMSELSWNTRLSGLTLAKNDYQLLATGPVTVSDMTGHVTEASDSASWNALGHLAREANVTPDQVMLLLQGLSNAKQQLSTAATGLPEKLSELANKEDAPVPSGVPVDSETKGEVVFINRSGASAKVAKDRLHN